MNGLTAQEANDARRKSLEMRRARRLKPRTPVKTQASSIQHALHNATELLSSDIKECEDKEQRARVASALASLAKGWDSITDRIRILSGTPMPGSRRPPPDQPKKAKVKSAPKPAPLPAPGSVKNSDSQV